MRRFWILSSCIGVFALLASAASAQTTMAKWGCNASPSCRQNGFSIVTGQDKEHTGILFDVTWEKGFHFELLRHANASEEAPKPPEQRFRLFPPSEKPPELQPAPPAKPESPPAKDGGDAR